MLKISNRQVGLGILFISGLCMFSVSLGGRCLGSEANSMENEGIMLIMQGKTDDGLALMKSSIKIEPNNPTLHMNYASILMAQGRTLFEAGQIPEADMLLKEAEEHLLLAAKLFKNSAPDRLSRSQCYALLGDIYLYAFGQKDKALKFYQQAITEDSANSGVKEIIKSLEQSRDL